MGAGNLRFHCSQRFLLIRWFVFPLVDEAWAIQVQLSGVAEEIFGLGKVSRSVRAETAGQYQHPAVHDVSVLCGERAAGDARQAFLTSCIYDQICLGNSVVQYLTKMSDKL